MTTESPHYTLTYHGQLRTSMQHQKSAREVVTDAPLDNHGKGEAFSPTDLVSAALASCVMTIMAIKAGDMGHKTIKMDSRVWKTMASNPRRIARIEVELDLHIPDVTNQQKLILERTTRACPVARSLHPDTQKEVVFNWL
ncbi:MAG: osmotically inducible protein OsmC [Crocinitomicaceae bacterium]|nr:osmotically inducible protein OsmC [Crocinitomicaceae bacterium]HBP45008.1 osmotically inducible protein OsmC [Flavobacteriales bacterium]|tara:strand:+ start:715 stop:1134 length:420 start_codon:yes stop_codon:yes gene_type:complete